MSDDTPPLRAPFHQEPIGGEDPVRPVDTLWTLSVRLSTTLKFYGPWRIGGWDVALVGFDARADEGGPFQARFRATERASGRAVDARLEITVDPSDWVKATVSIDGAPRWTGFIERAYEEFEIWPAGSPATAVDSGRIGKNCTWAQFEAEHWPGLAALAEGRFVTIDAQEDA